MTSDRLPDFLYQPAWTTPDHVAGIATVVLPQRCWKPTNLDEIDHDTPDDDKTKRVLRLPSVAGGQRVVPLGKHTAATVTSYLTSVGR